MKSTTHPAKLLQHNNPCHVKRSTDKNLKNLERQQKFIYIYSLFNTNHAFKGSNSFEIATKRAIDIGQLTKNERSEVVTFKNLMQHHQNINKEQFQEEAVLMLLSEYIDQKIISELDRLKEVSHTYSTSYKDYLNPLKLETKRIHLLKRSKQEYDHIFDKETIKENYKSILKQTFKFSNAEINDVFSHPNSILSTCHEKLCIIQNNIFKEEFWNKVGNWIKAIKEGVQEAIVPSIVAYSIIHIILDTVTALKFFIVDYEVLYKQFRESRDNLDELIDKNMMNPNIPRWFKSGLDANRYYIPEAELSKMDYSLLWSIDSKNITKQPNNASLFDRMTLAFEAFSSYAQSFNRLNVKKLDNQAVFLFPFKRDCRGFLEQVNNAGVQGVRALLNTGEWINNNLLLDPCTTYNIFGFKQNNDETYSLNRVAYQDKPLFDELFQVVLFILTIIYIKSLYISIIHAKYDKFTSPYERERFSSKAETIKEEFEDEKNMIKSGALENLERNWESYQEHSNESPEFPFYQLRNQFSHKKPKKQSLKIITPETQLNIPSFKEKEASFELYDDDTILSKFFDEKQREYINNASRAYKYIKPFKRGDKDCCATVNNNNYRVYKMLNKGGDRVLCLKIKGKYLPYRHLTHSDSDKLHSNKDASLLDRKEEALIGFLFHRGFID